MAMEGPYLFASSLVENPEGMMCQRQLKEAFGAESSYAIFLISEAMVFVYIPAVLLFALYSIILIKLKKQANPGEQTANAEEQLIRRNRKVLKMAIAIVVAFFIFWIPLFTNQLIFYFASDSLVWSSCSFILYKTITSFMAYANCAINPIICLIFSSNYRNGLERFVTCRRTRLTFEK